MTTLDPALLSLNVVGPALDAYYDEVDPEDTDTDDLAHHVLNRLRIGGHPVTDPQAAAETLGTVVDDYLETAGVDEVPDTVDFGENLAQALISAGHLTA